MTSNIGQFNLELDRFLGQQVPRLAVRAQKKITLDALRSVVRKSPVDTGRFRGNWQVSVSTPVTSTLSLFDSAARGSEPNGNTLAQAESALNSMQPYGISYLQNNLPYAEGLERGNSTQAPNGMVALTLAELQNQILEERDLGPA